ncbi:hypothetical protein SD80_017845 [Scytonema tolypothrichoides VB-61278]|nr:hypothetical protein SD80_017845 [Scytonema tolypothrichoides VB-61278]
MIKFHCFQFTYSRSFYQLSVTSYQSSVISYQLAVFTVPCSLFTVHCLLFTDLKLCFLLLIKAVVTSFLRHQFIVGSLFCN